LPNISLKLFTNIIGVQFFNHSVHFQPHLKCIATLPCEMFVLKNSHIPEVSKQTAMQHSANWKNC